MFEFNRDQNPILSALIRVHELAKKSSLTAATFSREKPALATLTEFFQSSDEQAIVLALLLYAHLTEEDCTIKELLDHTGLTLAEAPYINKLLLTFITKEWIAPKKNPHIYPTTAYSISPKLIRSVLSGKMESWEKPAINNSFQLLNAFQNKVSERKNNQVTYQQLSKFTETLMDTYKGIELADFLLQLHLEKNDALYFMYFCSQHFLGKENCDPDELIREINPPKEEQYRLRSSLRSGTNPLIALGLIKDLSIDDFYIGSDYVLTEKAVRAFDKTAVIRVKAKESMLQLIEPAAVCSKTLLFGKSEQQLIHKLNDIVSPDNFDRLSERLHAQGMKAGVTLLLYGSPGTGKTETVLQLGRSSNRHILHADASKIRSKWFGQTPKNIKALFDEYRKNANDLDQKPILLFNEADAILGKRSQLTEGVDQETNTMQNILLEELENFEGIFIATTNMEVNLDKAFERRFLYKIRFEKPGADTLMEIWKNKFPGLKKPALKKLCATFSLTGGQVENIRKKTLIESMLDEKIKINEVYLGRLAEQEIMPEKRRAPVGFLR